MPWLVAALLTGCAARTPPRTSLDASRAPRDELRGQWLFRAEIESPDGRLSLRLALRQFGDRDFELAAADALGQSIWRLLVKDEAAIWTDPVRRRFCRLGAQETPQLQRFRAPLPAGELSALLRGTLPEAPSGEEDPTEVRRAEVRDAAGRVWTGDRVAGRWRSWALWAADRPRLWWRMEGAEAILSGNDPAFQLRWRETAHGGLPPGSVLDMNPPDGFAEERCADAAGT